MNDIHIMQGDARDMRLVPDHSVDLIVTSPPFFSLRSYTDGGEHYDGQVGAEATPAEFVDALIECTREMARVLKPSGSIWVNLGDKYASSGGHTSSGAGSARKGRANLEQINRAERNGTGIPAKSLIGIPWRYALRCIDDLGLILRAEVIWSKPNGLPESVTDRVRRSHEQWFHFTVSPRYFSAVDEIREPHSAHFQKYAPTGMGGIIEGRDASQSPRLSSAMNVNPLGKLPGSVWTIATEPLRVPPELGVDHFAAFPSEWPRRLILGWSPREVCTACGEGRRPVADRSLTDAPGGSRADLAHMQADAVRTSQIRKTARGVSMSSITGYACACPDTSAPATPGVVLDPFGGTGTTAHVASALGRHGISVDLSADYCRLAAHPYLIERRAAKVQGRKAPRMGDYSPAGGT